MRYDVTDCHDISADRLRAAMNSAFSDYVVPLHLSDASFRDFQVQRGFSAAHSHVALADGEIAAFWFSGEPRANYGNRAYTLSVGTVPSYRRKGLAGRLLKATRDSLGRAGASGMQLEVISTNTGAVETYARFGFEHARRLRVCSVPRATSPPDMAANLTLHSIGLTDLPEETTDFFDTDPTPQNSRAALAALAPDIRLVSLRSDNELYGWAASYKDGAIAQIGVRKDARRQGLGRILLEAVAERVGLENLTFVNVDESAASLNGFLDRMGAKTLLMQSEMRLSF
ncbi:GNAT family N-acetyltransferase [Rhodobacterales bacterium]|nr:GNAT family N-acetyltransferase [Rhodobacterales bacterium]